MPYELQDWSNPHDPGSTLHCQVTIRPNVAGKMRPDQSRAAAP